MCSSHSEALAKAYHTVLKTQGKEDTCSLAVCQVLPAGEGHEGGVGCKLQMSPIGTVALGISIWKLGYWMLSSVMNFQISHRTDADTRLERRGNLGRAGIQIQLLSLFESN